MNIRIYVRWIAALLAAFAALVSVSLAVNSSLLAQARPLSIDYVVGGPYASAVSKNVMPRSTADRIREIISCLSPAGP
jgi:hypothetical protein